MTSPDLMLLAMIASSAAGSESNTRAGAVIAGFLSPVILATQPSVARLPRRIARWPCGYIGFDHCRITSWSARGAGGTSASTSAIVCPVTVMASP